MGNNNNNNNNNVKIPKWLKSLPIAPTYYPTDTEFADPISYISKIEKEACTFGICKIIPPLPKPSKKFVLNNLNKSLLKHNNNNSKKEGGRAVFTTRQQELGVEQNRKRGGRAKKQVWQSGEEYTLEEFEAKAKGFSKSVLGGGREGGSASALLVEALFWKAAKEKAIYVEYANDVPGSGFGEPRGLLEYLRRRKKRHKLSRGRDSSSGSVAEREGSGKEGGGGEGEGTAGWKLSNSPWNLQVIAKAVGSLTRFMLDDIPGVTSPMVYIAMLFSWFAWHVEDHELHSMNFLHLGSPKTWYAVPGDRALEFEDAIRRRAYGGDLDQLAALKLLGEKTTLLSPELVVASGIQCCRLVQNPGEFVVTFPRAYHVGFSHGFNCGEAANFGTPHWLTVAKDAAVRRAVMDHLPMLSHQQLLYLLTMSFTSSVPRSLLPGVRSSRLRDRLKEARELLVKKAFIDDILKQNKLLNTLVQKYSALHAVLWHPDLLPSVMNASPLQAGISDNALSNKDDELSSSLNEDASHDLLLGAALFMETMSDLYNSDDLLCDFQIDSGTLPCVACGILGYPFMAVVQPSLEAAEEVLQAKNLKLTWSAESSLKLKSSIIHDAVISDISEINVAKSWDTTGFLRPRFFCLEHAIEVEELLKAKGGARTLVICHSDYQKIKANAVVVAEEIAGAFEYKEVSLDAATEEELSLIDTAIDSEQFTGFEEDWTSVLGLNMKYIVKINNNCSSKKLLHALNVDNLLSLVVPGPKISTIKWCSRKSRNRRSQNHEKQKIYDNVSIKKCEMIPLQGGTLEPEKKVLLQYSRRKHKVKSSTCDVVDCVQPCSMDYMPEAIVTNGHIATSEQDNQGAVCVNITVTGYENIDSLVQEDIKVDDECSNGNSNVDSVSSSLTDILAIENPGTGGGSVVQNQKDWSSEEDLSSIQDRTCVTERRDGYFLDKVYARRVAHDHPASAMSKLKGVNVIYKNDCISTFSETTTTFEVGVPTFPKENQTPDRCQTSACSGQGNEHEDMIEKATVNVEMTSRKRSKRVGEADLHAQVIGIFVKGPCEGLRPRKKIHNLSHNCEKNISSVTELKSSSTMVKKCSGSKVTQSKAVCEGPYKCKLEGCRMSLKTTAELSLHRKNKCHYNECRTKFKSHKYLILHQRVHDDERPLKCAWKGCSMSFKWAWARIEHLRLHTGERPYKCAVEGCDRTFVYVSDFSRHRRKLGHYVK